MILHTTMASAETSKSTSSSVVSQTSTDLYGHETWEEFAPRVHRLCRQLWPSESDEFDVEKMKGGGYTRTFGIQTPPTDRFILRVPRYEFAQQEREMTILRYVRQHTSIPTAQIVFFDSTTTNPLEEPYVVHTRIPGQDLHAVYRTLNHEHKSAIAEQLGQILLSQLAVRNDFAGIVDTITDDNQDVRIYGFRPFEVNPDPENEDVRLLSKQSILDILILQFERWIAADKRAFPVSRTQKPSLRDLQEIVMLTSGFS